MPDCRLQALGTLPAVDAHCHPFREPDPTTLADWERFFTLFVPADQCRPHPFPSTMLLEALLNELARFLGCSPEEVVERRAKEASNFSTYTQRLFQDAGIAALIVDRAFPPASSQKGVPLPPNVPVWEVLRLEPLIDRLLGLRLSFPELVRYFDQEVSEALLSGRYVGLKTIIAYRTGLDLNDSDASAAQKSLEARYRGAETSLAPLRNHLVLRALEIGAGCGKPVQIHTGLGDQEINFRRARPELLYDVLNREPYRRAKVVLVHAGYPWHRSAACMVAALPNVYLDLSFVAPYVHWSLERVLEEILAVAPVTKILYGSDGYNLPEMNWFAARLCRRALKAYLLSLVEDKAVRPEYALWVASRILSENAAELYGLDLSR